MLTYCASSQSTITALLWHFKHQQIIDEYDNSVHVNWVLFFLGISGRFLWNFCLGFWIIFYESSTRIVLGFNIAVKTTLIGVNLGARMVLM